MGRNRVLLDTSRGGPGAARLGQALQRAALALLRRYPLKGVELSLTLVRDPEIRALNKQWRRKDKPTDVLSFSALEESGRAGPPVTFPGTPGGRELLGDVVISLDTARRQAKAYGQTLGDELHLYLAHGLLHLLGHDHHTPQEARAMEAEERRLLRVGGMLSRSDEVD